MADVKRSRREKASATRGAILRAAHAEFVEQGFHGATVAAIARRAGVAPQTVYFVFHTKPDLISAVIDAAVIGDEPLPPDELPWWQAMRDEPDAAESLRIFVRGAGEVLARAAAVSEVLRAAALTDAEVRRTHEAHEARQRAAWGEVLDVIVAKGALREDLPRERLLDVFLVTFGDAAYQLYLVEHGWSEAEVTAWMSLVLPALLLADGTDGAVVSPRPRRSRGSSRSAGSGRSPG